jgi:hypothetical protein
MAPHPQSTRTQRSRSATEQAAWEHSLLPVVEIGRAGHP